MSAKTIIVLATRNSGKVREFQMMLEGYPVEIRGLGDFGPIPEAVEDGATFDDNAYKKALHTAKVLGLPAIADDSGLVVEALDGAPGVYSARYAGEKASDRDNIAKLLARMQGRKDRKAAFECVISIAVPSGPALTYEGRCEGEITEEPRGEGGFGYDPVFYYPPFGKTFAEIPLEEKNKVSHRGRALAEVRNEFDKILKWLNARLTEVKPPKPDHTEFEGNDWSTETFTPSKHCWRPKNRDTSSCYVWLPADDTAWSRGHSGSFYLGELYVSMPFVLPLYLAPDFRKSPLAEAPFVTFRKAPQCGVLPEDFHATTIFPEYFHLEKAGWVLLEESRMDCGVVLTGEGTLAVREFRHIGKEDLVACGRRENGEDGILVHTEGFAHPEQAREKFSFRTRASRETSFSADYDELYALLHHERQNGFVLWVLGPAVAFDRDAREAMVRLIDNGFVHGLLAGNGLAVHDLEGAFFGTALGLEIYARHAAPFGHYNHLETINRVRAAGSIEEAIRRKTEQEGIIHAAVRNRIPYVLAGSIRDDGPLPGVVGDAYLAQDRMRELTKQATTVIALATQLHSIATGNMVPSYRVTEEGEVRPVYFYAVDMSEFVLNKLANRGSLAARTILTNAQDFLVTLSHGLLPAC